jgi:hypothetical protein
MSESKKDEAVTAVVFVIGAREKDVTAVFPALPGTSGDDMACFSHIGQHSHCSVGWYNKTRNAFPNEYDELKRELESAPYNYRLRVYTRITEGMHKERRALASQ